MRLCVQINLSEIPTEVQNKDGGYGDGLLQFFHCCLTQKDVTGCFGTLVRVVPKEEFSTGRLADQSDAISERNARMAQNGGRGGECGNPSCHKTESSQHCDLCRRIEYCSSECQTAHRDTKRGHTDQCERWRKPDELSADDNGCFLPLLQNTRARFSAQIPCKLPQNLSLGGKWDLDMTQTATTSTGIATLMGDMSGLSGLRLNVC